MKLIQTIAAGWDWALCSAILVAELDSGLWELIDGQHRASAALALRLPVLPAFVVKNRDRAARAAAFVHLNTLRVATTDAQRLKAAMQAGDDAALRVKRACAATGAQALFSPRNPYKPGQSLAASALIKLARARGETGLAACLAPCVAAGLAPIRAIHLQALETLFFDDRWSRDQIDEARLAQALRDWDHVLDQADLARLDTGQHRREALAVELWRRAGASDEGEDA